MFRLKPPDDMLVEKPDQLVQTRVGVCLRCHHSNNVARCDPDELAMCLHISRLLLDRLRDLRFERRLTLQQELNGVLHFYVGHWLLSFGRKSVALRCGFEGGEGSAALLSIPFTRRSVRRLACRQFLHRSGGSANPCLMKNSCSPANQINSCSQSAQLSFWSSYLVLIYLCLFSPLQVIVECFRLVIVYREDSL